MKTDPDKEIRDLFARAALRNQAARGLSGDGWAAYQKIHADHAAEVRLQERRFLIEYQSRFEVTRKRIIDEGGMRDRKLVPRWFGSDKFDAAVIDRQADREVRMAHEGFLNQLRELRDVSLDGLFDTDRDKKDRREKLVIDFSKAADRRSDKDRGGPSR